MSQSGGRYPQRKYRGLKSSRSPAAYEAHIWDEILPLVAANVSSDLPEEEVPASARGDRRLRRVLLVLVDAGHGEPPASVPSIARGGE